MIHWRFFYYQEKFCAVAPLPAAPAAPAAVAAAAVTASTVPTVPTAPAAAETVFCWSPWSELRGEPWQASARARFFSSLRQALAHRRTKASIWSHVASVVRSLRAG